MGCHVCKCECGDFFVCVKCGVDVYMEYGKANREDVERFAKENPNYKPEDD